VHGGTPSSSTKINHLSRCRLQQAVSLNKA
jgi:hypothetical protein